MNQKSTKKKHADKRPPKSKVRPLFAHQTSRLAKKVRGKLHYFGRSGRVEKGEVIPVENLDEAIQEAKDLYEEQKNDLEAGRTVQKKSEDDLTIKKLVNDYLNSKRKLLNTGELSKHTYSEWIGNLLRAYMAHCEGMLTLESGIE